MVLVYPWRSSVSSFPGHCQTFSQPSEVAKASPNLSTSHKMSKIQKPDSADVQEDCAAAILYLNAWCALDDQSYLLAMDHRVPPGRPHKPLRLLLCLRSTR